MKNRERGSYTVEAALALPIFMFAFLAIVSLAKIARVECTTQYAINQVAKEIAQYYYIAERVGIANTNQEGVKSVDEAISAVFDFADLTKEKASEYTSSDGLVNAIQDLSGVQNDINEISTAANDLYASFEPIFQDPKGIVSSLANMMLKEVANEVITKIIAQPLCRMLVPKYIISNGNPDAALRSMGVVDGLDGLNFKMSSFLSDQRSINVVVVYQIKVDGFGIFDNTLVIQQTASTAAWVTGTKLKDVAQKSNDSLWNSANSPRGMTFVDLVKNDTPTIAVKGGKGVDLYDQYTNTFTSIHSLNVFQTSYSTYQAATDDPNKQTENYILKDTKIQSAIKSHAMKLVNNVDKIKSTDMLTMQDGRTCQPADENVQHRELKIIMVVPSEAMAYSGTLNEIAEAVKNDTGVEVSFTYRQNALSSEKKPSEDES